MTIIQEEEQTGIFLRCAFCGGRGKDPFGVMSRLSTCYVCGGKKELSVKKPVKKCPVCGGNGVSPVGARNYCAVCRGSGVVHLKEPSKPCPTCRGTGWYRPVGLYCNVCKGAGVIETEKGV